MATCGIPQADQAELLKKQIVRLGKAGTALASREPPAGAGAAGRAFDLAQASSEPLSGARVGGPAGVSASVPQGADVAESCVGQTVTISVVGFRSLLVGLARTT
jgi:hypothetical protein